MNSHNRFFFISPCGFLLATGLVILAPNAWGQASAGSPAKAKAAAHAAQASDGDVKAIADLVHAGNYAAARQLDAALLASYPDDQRLIQAHALLDKLLAAPPASPAQTPAQPANGAAAGQLTGMDRVDYNALIQRAREAQQTTDLPQQTALLKQFMADSSQFLAKHPEQTLVWQLRAAAAMSLNDLDKGYEAGQKLLAAGAADSNDPNLQQLTAQLKNKGWLDRDFVEQFDQKTAEENRYGWLLGRWAIDAAAPGIFGTNHTNFEIEFLKTGPNVYGYLVEGNERTENIMFKFTPAGSIPSAADFGFTNWGNANPTGFQPLVSFSLADDRKTMTLGTKSLLNTDIAEVFTKMDGTQPAVQAPVSSSR